VADDGWGGPDHAPVPVPKAGDALTPGWLSGALAPGGTAVTGLAVQPVGEGIGLLGALQRVEFDSDGHGGSRAPASVVVKRPSPGERSRQVGLALGMYRNEVLFYRHLGAETPLAIGCHHAAMDDETGDFVVVLEDMTACETVDQIQGCPPGRAAAIVDALADHHAGYWAGARLAPHGWLRWVDDAGFVGALAGAFAAAWPAIRDRHGDGLPAGVLDLGDRFPALLPDLAAELAAEPVTLSHGDVRLDNMFFGPGERVTLCDWQLVDRSRGCRDLAYFLSQSLRPEDRATHERPLLDRYRRRLASRSVDYPEDAAWRDYQVATLFTFAYPVVAGAGLDLDDRSTRLTDVILERSVAALVDLDCLTLG
jgi:Ecdysteroid kinase-like family